MIARQPNGLMFQCQAFTTHRRTKREQFGGWIQCGEPYGRPHERLLRVLPDPVAAVPAKERVPVRHEPKTARCGDLFAKANEILQAHAIVIGKEDELRYPRLFCEPGNQAMGNLTGVIP